MSKETQKDIPETMEPQADLNQIIMSLANRVAAAEERANKAEQRALDIQKVTAPVIAAQASQRAKRVRSTIQTEEYVTVQLPMTFDEASEDVYVGVNGETKLIKRGYPVKIQRKMAMALEHQAQQDRASYYRNRGMSDRFISEAKELKLV